MNTYNLFPEFQAYVSSALTISDPIERDRIKTLNIKIKEWLAEDLKIFAYLPQEYSDPSRDSKMAPEEVYILDRWRIAESDFILLNMNLPSFGVGQEAEIATSIGVPIIPFHYFQLRVTRILRGLPGIFMSDQHTSPSEAVIAYQDNENYEDLKDQLLGRIKLLKTKLMEQVVKKTDSEYESFSSLLKKAMKNKNETPESLSIKTGLSISFINSLLADFKSIKKMLEPYEILKVRDLKNININKYLNPGLWVLKRLSEALNIRISTLIGEDELDSFWHSPLVSLSREGISLEEFISVLEDTDYYISYGKAAKLPRTQEYSEKVKKDILKLIKPNK